VYIRELNKVVCFVRISQLSGNDGSAPVSSVRGKNGSDRQTTARRRISYISRFEERDHLKKPAKVMKIF
jgi:hypothetical protein